MTETKGPLPFWPPNTKVRIKIVSGETGPLATIERYAGDGFYSVIIEEPGEEIQRLSVFVEDLELIQ